MAVLDYFVAAVSAILSWSWVLLFELFLDALPGTCGDRSSSCLEACQTIWPSAPECRYPEPAREMVHSGAIHRSQAPPQEFSHTHKHPSEL